MKQWNRDTILNEHLKTLKEKRFKQNYKEDYRQPLF